MRTSVANGDAEMVAMLIDAKTDVNKRGTNVSACIHGIVRLLYKCFARAGLSYYRAWLIVHVSGRDPHFDRGWLGAPTSGRDADQGDHRDWRRGRKGVPYRFCCYF